MGKSKKKSKKLIKKTLSKDIELTKRKKPPDTRPYMITTKNYLNKIITDLLSMNILNDTVNRTNKIVFHTYNFLKFYYLYIFDKKQNNRKIDYPNLNVQFIRNIMNIVSYKLRKGGKPSLKNDITISLKNFYDEHYKPLLVNDDLVCRDKLKHILNYEEIDIIKNIETNISEHYLSHLKFFIRIYFGIDELIKKIKSEKLSKNETKQKTDEMYEIYGRLIIDIFNVKDKKYISDKKYYNDINKLHKWFIPNKVSFRENSVYYDVKVNPSDYLPNMILLNKKLEEIHDENIKNHDPKKSNYPVVHKLLNAFPLRTSIIPKYITLDTAGLISLFVKNNSKYYLSDMLNCKDGLWWDYFNTNMRCFRRNGYIFNNMIKTDGIGCSIIMIKTDENGNPVDPPSFKELKEIKEMNDIQYIDEVLITEEMKNKRIIVNDPGKSASISCMRENDEDLVLTSTENKYKLSGNTKDFLKNIHFEYTQGQRNHDIKKRKYEEIKNEFKKEKIGEKSVSEIESKLTDYNSKTCNLERFKEYLSMKIKVNRLLYDHYNQFIYRKLKWNSFINKRKSEDNMMNNFKEKMGSPEDVLLVLGDYSDNGFKGKAPCMTRGIIKIFKRHGYEPYLLDEYNTSKKSCCCDKGETENFLPRIRTETWKEKNGTCHHVENRDSLIWKLVRCTICKSIHNRDHNATKNMMIIVKSILSGKGRPEKYQRPKNMEKQKLVKKKEMEIIVV